LKYRSITTDHVVKLPFTHYANTCHSIHFDANAQNATEFSITHALDSI